MDQYARMIGAHGPNDLTFFNTKLISLHAKAIVIQQFFTLGRGTQFELLLHDTSVVLRPVRVRAEYKRVRLKP